MTIANEHLSNSLVTHSHNITRFSTNTKQTLFNWDDHIIAYYCTVSDILGLSLKM